ncbi:ATP synthase F1 subunit delta [Flavobacteriaceae bacterium]|nr:ATP synthase F1 subunit delta [Flavobacteriaceae bacterium]
MKGTRASLRYAKATLAFAEETKSSQSVNEDMQSLMGLIAANEELSLVLENPMLGSDKKEAVMNALLPNASEETKKFFSLLATNNRMELLAPTCDQFIQLYAAQKGEVKAIVTTAIPMTAELKKQVLQEAKKLSDKKAILENKIDSSIIGGYILKIGDMQYDASVSNQLKAIKATLTKTNSI